jgi:PAS domain S-box-containing protein
MKELHLLIAARYSKDAKRIEQTVRSTGRALSSTYAHTLESLAEALRPNPPDIIAVYHSPSSFSGITALELAREVCPAVPLLVIAVGAGRELREKMLLAGARACIEEDRIDLLPGLIHEAVNESASSAMPVIELPALVRPEQVHQTLPVTLGDEKNVLDTMLEMVVLLDTERRVIWANRAASEYYGVTAEEMMGRVCYEVWYGSSQPCSGCPVARTLRDGEQCEREMVLPSGQVLFARSCPIRDGGGQLIGAVLNSLDITERVRFTENLRLSADEIRKAMEGTIHAMALTIEMRDSYTAGHQRRVTQLACLIGRETGLPDDRIAGLRQAASIHDVGKMYVPSEILTKPSRLSDAEFNLIKAHPVVGYQLLINIEFPWPVAQIVLEHHERLNGSGYPSGILGCDILPEARVLAVADVVEAIASHRPYRPALGIDEALAHIESNRGVIYDTHAAEACLDLFTGGFTFEE